MLKEKRDIRTEEKGQATERRHTTEKRKKETGNGDIKQEEKKIAKEERKAGEREKKGEKIKRRETWGEEGEGRQG